MKSFKLMLLVALYLGNQFAKSNSIDTVVDVYLDVKKALVIGDSKNASVQAGLLETAIRTNLTTPELKVDEIIKHAAVIYLNEKNLEDQRTAFGELSKKLWVLLKGFPMDERELFYNYCPMKKQYWIDQEPTIRNPFYGNKMLSCGQTIEKLHK